LQRNRSSKVLTARTIVSAFNQERLPPAKMSPWKAMVMAPAMAAIGCGRK
jgi:hypothetical protein